MLPSICTPSLHIRFSYPIDHSLIVSPHNRFISLERTIVRAEHLSDATKIDQSHRALCVHHSNDINTILISEERFFDPYHPSRRRLEPIIICMRSIVSGSLGALERANALRSLLAFLFYSYYLERLIRVKTYLQRGEREREGE